MILFSDMFDNNSNEVEIMSALQHLKHNKHEVLFHVTDKQTEFEFNFEDRPYEFIDVETQEKVRLNPASIRKEFKERMDSYYHDLYLKCAQLKIDMIKADISLGFDQILNAYLIKRRKMR